MNNETIESKLETEKPLIPIKQIIVDLEKVRADYQRVRQTLEPILNGQATYNKTEYKRAD